MFRRNPARRERARRVVEAFRQHGATSPEKAMTSEQLGLPGRFDEFMDRRGGRSGIIVEVSEGKYYLDEARLKETLGSQATPEGGTVVIKEREIVKIRCSYCGNLYEITENKCPTCGAPAGK
jgi:hypothetical protein